MLARECPKNNQWNRSRPRRREVRAADAGAVVAADADAVAARARRPGCRPASAARNRRRNKSNRQSVCRRCRCARRRQSIKPNRRFPVHTRHSTPISAPVSVSFPPLLRRAPAAHAAKPEGSVIGRTVDEVRQIVESLEQALEQMEEVLRLVELAEHQKFDDERELESLRRALHKLQPPHRERREQGGSSDIGGLSLGL